LGGEHRDWVECLGRESNHGQWLLLLYLHGGVCKVGRHCREEKRQSREVWDGRALAEERLVRRLQFKESAVAMETEKTRLTASTMSVSTTMSASSRPCSSSSIKSGASIMVVSTSAAF
jgi:hypothetical protein